MKKTTLQKIALTTMAVLASLALNAQAGRTAVSSAKQAHGSHDNGGKPTTAASTSFHRLLFADSTYMVDDGTAEDSIGLTSGGDVIALNEFAVTPGNATITSVSIAWGTPAFPDPSLNGLPYTVVVWSDPNNDGNPSDAQVLTTANDTIKNAGTDTFVTTTITPTTITTQKFFVGFLVSHGAGQFPAAFDESNPKPNRSYIAGGATGDINNLNNNDLPVAPIESFGLVGNWLIRADTGNATITPTPTPTPTPMGDALWYNGDFDGVNGLANEQDTSLGFGTSAHVYDDFNVTDSEGWDVTSVFSNNLADTGITGATWEIRQGVSTGNAGSLIASGMTATPTVTPTGRDGFGFTEFMVEVNGVSVHLDPGTYWLNVTPIGNGSGRSFDSTTNGANCIGTPCGNDGMAFFTSDFFGFFYTPTDDPALANGHDFSMGVNGTVGGGGGGDLTLQSASSRKRHKTAGVFNVPLPLTGDEGIEGRAGADTIVLTFNNKLTGVGSVTSSCGDANAIIASTDPRSVVVDVASGHCNGRNITITVTGVTDDQGNTTSASVTYGKLVGDVTGDGVVNFRDIRSITAASPAHTDSTNFRNDVNTDGKVDSQDQQPVRRNRGNMLP